MSGGERNFAALRSVAMPMKTDLRFWLLWLGLSLGTTILVGPLSPFLGLNLVAYTAGWERFGDPAACTVVVLSAILAGIAMGSLGLLLLRRHIGRKGWPREPAALVAFVVASLISTGNYVVLSSGFILGFLLLCFGSLILWLISTGILISLPLLYSRDAPTKAEPTAPQPQR